jgi:hypothetical protein
MKDSVPSDTGEAGLRCSYCERNLPNGAWFARIRRGGRLLDFCSPRCLEKFLDGSTRKAGESEVRYDATALSQLEL